MYRKRNATGLSGAIGTCVKEDRDSKKDRQEEKYRDSRGGQGGERGQRQGGGE